MSDRRDESFIPWEQIEPLIREGMTATELKREVLAKIGLSSTVFTLFVPIVPLPVETVLAVTRRYGGVLVIREDEHMNARYVGPEVLR